MHGMIFVELKKYVDARLGASAWEILLKETGMTGRMYLAVEHYPDQEAIKLVSTASRITRKGAGSILEDFGEFITPDLMKMYGAMARKEWKTLDFLENTEATIHRVVRIRNPGASPPELKVSRTGDDEVTILYGSPRKMCALARGLVHGVARHYGEEVRVVEPQCMHKGAKQCKLVVQLRSLSGAHKPIAT